MPPLAGIGLCWSRPLAMYGPSSALMAAISRAPKRSGHISAPSRLSSSLAAALSRGARSPTQARDAVTAGFVLHGDHQVRPFRGQVAGQDNPAHIVLVQSLHDHHDG